MADKRLISEIGRFQTDQLQDGHITADFHKSIEREMINQCSGRAYNVSDASNFNVCQIYRNTIENTTPNLDSEATAESKAETKKLKNGVNILMKQEKHLEDLTNYIKEIQLDDQNVAYYCNRAVVHKKLGNHALAITDCQTALRINPSYSEAYNLLGNILSDEKEHHEALANFTKAIQLNNKNIVYYRNRAHVHKMLGNHVLAIKDCQTALSIDPSCSEAYNFLGNILLDQKEHHEALANFTKAIQLNDQNIVYYHNRAHVHKMLSNHALAIKDCHMALSIDPSLSNVYAELGYILMKQEKYQEALANYTKAIQLDDQYVSCYCYRAAVHIKLSNHVLAIKDCQTALSIDPSCSEAYNLLGNIFSDQKEHHEALVNYTKAIQLNDRNVVYYRNRAHVHKMLGNHVLAIKDCQTALSIDPSCSEAYNFLGNILLDQKEHHEALANFTKAIQLNDQNIVYYHNRAHVHKMLGNHALAIKDCHMALSIDPSLSNVYAELGHILMKQEKYQEALANYTKAIQLDDQYVPCYCYRAAVHIKLSNHVLAIKDCQTALSIDPSCSEAYNLLGNIFSDQKEHHEALVNYTKAIQLNDRNVVYYHNRAHIHKMLDNHALAITDCETALSIDPSCSKAYNLLGNIFSDQKEHHEAIVNYTKAIQLNDHNVVYYFNRAIVHIKLDNDALAIKDCHTALSIDPSHISTYVQLGHILMKQKEYHEALANFTKAIQLDDHNAGYYCNRAHVHKMLGNHALAIKDCHTALSIDPSLSNIYAELGHILMKQKEYHEALANFTKAIQLDDHNAGYYCNRAHVHIKLDNDALAIKDYHTVLSIDPSHISTYVQLGHIFMKQKEYHEALANFTKAIQLNDQNVVYYCNRAHVHKMLGNHALAIKDCHTALSIDPSLSFLYAELGDIFMKQEKYQEVLANYTKAIQLDDHIAVYYCNRAIAHTTLDNNALAIKDCHTALSVDPSHISTYVQLGHILMKQKEYNEALANYTKAIQLDDHIAAYYCNRALAHIMLGNHALAIKDCHTALSIDPSYSKAYARLGFVLRKQEKYHEALANFTKAIQLDDHNIEYYINRALVHEKLGNRALGIKDHNTALSMNPSCRDTHNYLKNISVLIDQKEYHEALANYTKLIQLNGLAAFHYKVGGTKIGNSVRAIKDSLTALSIDPSNSEAYTQLGLSFCNLGVKLRKGTKRL